jgi:amino acid adenylation domain-containing protein
MTGMETSSELRQQLLQRLRGGHLPTAEKPAELAIQPVSGKEIPLSCGQQQLWLHSQFAPDAPIYNESITVRKRGFLDAVVLEAAFNEIVSRHAIWRTGFADGPGGVVQIVHPHLHVALPLVDLTHLTATAAEAEAVRVASEDASAIFDLQKPPLLRARVFRLAEDDHRLYLTFHHLVFDGVSVYRVFLPELASVYRAFLSGSPSPLPDLPIQYSDYAAWQQRKLARGDYAHQLNYWRESLGCDAHGPEAPRLDLPVSRPAQATPAWRAGMEPFAFTPQLSKAVKRLAGSEGASVYMTLMAAFHVLLHRYSGQEEITTGGVVSIRNRPEIEPLIGYLLNTVVLRSRVDASLSFREFLKQIRDRVLNALANSDVPFDAVVRELAPRRDLNRNALFQVLFSLRPHPSELPDGWSLTEFDVHSGASGFDLFADLVEGPECLSGRLIYSAALFRPALIRRMIGHLRTLLEAMAANPDSPLAWLPLLTDRERTDLTDAGAGRTVDEPAPRPIARFELAARNSPSRAAAIFEDQQLTYGELDSRASAFAARLREAGATPGSLVALSVERSLELVIALLAIWKIGAAYLPLDPDLPAERREFVITDANPDLCVTATDLQISIRHRDTSGHPPGLAYVLYTSGSTGVPKGVAVPQTAVANLLRSMQREPGFSADDSLLAVTTLSFDIAVLEIFLPLVSGGTLVIASNPTVKDPHRLTDTMIASRCTVMQGTPALWRSLIETGWRGDPRLKVLCGGEALSRSLADDLVCRCRELWNMYGPTETTVWSLIQKVEHGPAIISIGRPIDNTQVYVLDRRLQLLPAEVTGELYIGGAGVARGYVGRLPLTRERFVPNPFRSGECFYRTGDLARWNGDGTLEFLGRVDSQVKVRGFRIELQEVEEALARCPEVRSAAVKAWPDASGENALVAYVEGAVDASALRGYLRRKLPEYMIPSRFIELRTLPRTSNGKLDRNALPEPGSAALSTIECSAPRNETERRVAGIWAELLHTGRPHINQDFFALGGHSLLAASMLRRIEIEFGKRLTISALFENPTIAGLSALLAPSVHGSASAGIGGATPTGQLRLDWIYAGAYFRDLAARLRPACRLHAVSLPHEIEAQVRVTGRLEDVARLIVDELRSTHPQGPYSLGGWCVAGILAYEVAVQLEELGEEVGFVALLGAPNPRHYTSVPRSDRLKRKLRHHWKHLTNLNAAGVSQYLAERARRQIQWRNPLRSSDFDHVISELALRYTPPPLHAPVALFQSADRPAGTDYAPGWEGVVAGPFAAYEVPGTHSTSLGEPNVAVLAEGLLACFDPNGVRLSPSTHRRKA